MIEAETYQQLVVNVPHILFELTWEAISGVIFYPVIRYLLRRTKARWHREIDAEHGVVHTEPPHPHNVRVVVMEEATYHFLVDKLGKDVVTEAEKWIR